MKKRKGDLATPWREANWRRWFATLAILVGLSAAFLWFPQERFWKAVQASSPSQHLPQKVHLRSFSRAEVREASRARVARMRDLQAARAERRRQEQIDPRRKLRNELRRERPIPLVPDHLPPEVIEQAGLDAIPEYMRDAFRGRNR
jgi:hypothetical protein